jgi:endonuclease G
MRFCRIVVRIAVSIIFVFTAVQAALAGEWNCNGHVEFGIPGGEDQLLCREGYAVGYDFARKGPLWVAYHITKESVEKKRKRSNSFKVDREVSTQYRSALNDYKHSGYDRGHMAPAATMDFSKKSMQESFLLSNMTPQLPGLNRQGWRYLEEYIRTWAEQRSELYVVTGALFEGEEKFIGDRVSVPSGYFKVVFDLMHCAGLAFIVPQKKISKAQLPDFIVSIDEVEARSGLDFLALLSDEVEANIEEVIGVMW